MQTLNKWKIHVPLFVHPRKTRSPIHLCIFANNDIWEIFYEDLWSVSMEGKILQSFIYIYIYIYNNRNNSRGDFNFSSHF